MGVESEKNPRIVAITGSVRPGNFTSMALHLVVDEIGSQQNFAVEVIDPAELDLPFPGEDGNSEDIKRLQEAVSIATGVVLATPEYHGSFSSVMKVVIENLGFPSVLAGKPVALLGVAAGQIGAIKSLEQLRGVCSHVGAIVLPGAVSIAGVQNLFDKAGRCLDEATEQRIRSVAINLIDYIKGHICPKVALEQMVRSRR